MAGEVEEVGVEEGEASGVEEGGVEVEGSRGLKITKVSIESHLSIRQTLELLLKQPNGPYPALLGRYSVSVVEYHMITEVHASSWRESRSNRVTKF